MFSLVKSFDNRKETKVKRLPTINDRTWTRRIQWLEDDGLIKLKLEDGDRYKEILVSEKDANTIWARFKHEYTNIDDCISIFGGVVPTSMQSRRATGN